MCNPFSSIVDTTIFVVGRHMHTKPYIRFVEIKFFLRNQLVRNNFNVESEKRPNYVNDTWLTVNSFIQSTVYTSIERRLP